MSKENQSTIIRKILPGVVDFKEFWKDEGPFEYALTSQAFPPILMEEEEWIFGRDRRSVIKALMGFKERKMAFVKAPFNPENTACLRPENLIPWKISHFPEEWNPILCSAYVPEGYLTREVGERLPEGETATAALVENAFFEVLEENLEAMGYVLLAPRGKSRHAVVARYVEEWEEDEKEAGLL